MLYIGVDLGTSAVKLILMDELGDIKNTVTEEYPTDFPNPGWSQQNPEDWWEKTCLGIRKLISQVDSSEISGISFGGQMHGLVILDGQDKVIRPAILWNDGRTARETDYLNKVIGKDRLVKYTGNIAFSGFTAPKLLWVSNNEYENFIKIKKIMLPKDYLIYKMTGVFATDYSDAAGTLLFDVAGRCWSKEMLSLCEISESQLPNLYESFESVGDLLPEVAQELGLPKDCVVAAGAADNAAAALGTGTVFGGNTCNISLGTSGTIFLATEEYQPVSNHAIHSFTHADGRYYLMGCMLSAASCNKWWMEQILKDYDYKGQQDKISDIGHNNVFFAPYLMGERSPHNDESVRGAFLGLGMDTTREQMTLAMLEGVAYGLRDSLEIIRESGIQVDRATVCGGGAKSQLWRKILANALNLTIDSVAVEEGPAYGAAILAAVAAGEYTTVREAVTQITKVVSSQEPEEDLVESYNEGYQHFKEIYPVIKKWRK